MKFLVLMCFLSLNLMAGDVHFDRADEIKEEILRGRVQVKCQDRGVARYITHICDQSNLQGGNYGHIVVTNGTIDADTVKIQAEGSRYIKSSGFNPKTGKSKAKFNLWINTLFQRAVLDRGVNTIRYVFLKDSKIVLEGTFDVEVRIISDRDCGFGSLYYGSACPSYEQVCRDFYWQNNFCAK